MKFSIAAFLLLTLLFTSTSVSHCQSNNNLFRGLICEPDRRAESSPTPMTLFSKVSTSSTLQKALHENQFTQRITLSGPFQPSECCFKFTTHIIPLYLINSFYQTSSDCNNPGIIFLTIKNKLICANPKDPWVQRHIKNLLSKSNQDVVVE